MDSVFVSYAHEDAPRADAIERVLEGFGADVWTFQKLKPGQIWWDEIDKRLAESKVIVLCITPSFLGSRWAQLEMGYALARSRDEGVTVVPVILKDAKLPKFLSQFNVIDARGLSAEEVADQVRSLASGLRAAS